MKKNCSFLWVMMTVTMLCFGFTSCGEEEDDSRNTPLKTMAGYWYVSLNYHMVLFNEGVMKGFGYVRESSKSTRYLPTPIITGNWEYNEQTKTLATSALFDGNNLQWLITMLNDNNWTGIALWNDKNTTYTASNDLDHDELTLLLDGKWVNDAGNTLTISFSKSSTSSSTYYPTSFSTDEKAEIDLDNMRNRNNYMVFDELPNTKNGDVITLQSTANYYNSGDKELYREGDGMGHRYVLKIINPYSYNNRRISIINEQKSFRNGEVVTHYKFVSQEYHIHN